MVETRRINRVHRSLSRPLTILGAERKLFFFAMCLGAATFNLLNSLFGGLLMFFLLFHFPARHTQNDPQILRNFHDRGKALRAEYDPMKFSPIATRKDGSCSGLAESSRTTARPALLASRSISTVSSVHSGVSDQDGRGRRRPRSQRRRLRVSRRRFG